MDKRSTNTSKQASDNEPLPAGSNSPVEQKTKVGAFLNSKFAGWFFAFCATIILGGINIYQKNQQYNLNVFKAESDQKIIEMEAELAENKRQIDKLNNISKLDMEIRDRISQADVHLKAYIAASSSGPGLNNALELIDGGGKFPKPLHHSMIELQNLTQKCKTANMQDALRLVR